jgi:hypothetical protein
MTSTARPMSSIDLMQGTLDLLILRTLTWGRTTPPPAID